MQCNASMSYLGRIAGHSAPRFGVNMSGRLWKLHCGKMPGPTVRNGLFGQARLLLTASFLGRKLLNQAFRVGRRFV